PNNQVRKTDREVNREQRKRDGEGGFREKRTGFEVKVAKDGHVSFRDRNARWAPLGAAFDVTEWAMRLHGEDPYAYQKRQFLDETRDERVGMAVKTRKQRLDEALRQLPAMLAAVAAEPTLAPADRRRVIFQLWDECAETGN